MRRVRSLILRLKKIYCSRPKIHSSSRWSTFSRTISEFTSSWNMSRQVIFLITYVLRRDSQKNRSSSSQHKFYLPLATCMPTRLFIEISSRRMYLWMNKDILNLLILASLSSLNLTKLPNPSVEQLSTWHLRYWIWRAMDLRLIGGRLVFWFTRWPRDDHPSCIRTTTDLVFWSVKDKLFSLTQNAMVFLWVMNLRML